MEKECLHEIKNMKNAVVFSSKTGNTKQLADEIRNVLPEETIKYFGSPETAPLDADCYYVGFWTDKGHCNAEIGTFLKKIKGKEVFLFGTAGFGGDTEYFDKILKKVGEECSETIIAAKNGEMGETVGEISDLIYHVLVMMADQNIPLNAVLEELDRRSQKIGNLKQFHQTDHET